MDAKKHNFDQKKYKNDQKIFLTTLLYGICSLWIGNGFDFLILLSIYGRSFIAEIRYKIISVLRIKSLKFSAIGFES
jgi:hypothetical protein